MYPPIEPGQKVDLDWRHNDYRMACCDCNLVHTFRFAVVGNILRIRAWREPHRTGALRRYRGIPIAPPNYCMETEKRIQAAVECKNEMCKLTDGSCVEKCDGYEPLS